MTTFNLMSSKHMILGFRLTGSSTMARPGRYTHVRRDEGVLMVLFQLKPASAILKETHFPVPTSV